MTDSARNPQDDPSVDRLLEHVDPAKRLFLKSLVVGAAFVARAWFMQRLEVGDCLILGVALGIVGMAGDLVESMLKRSAGVKDSARLVPGHGGLLDRVDSLLYAAPVLYYYFMFTMRIS